MTARPAPFLRAAAAAGLTAVAALAASGCSSTTTYEDPEELEILSEDFSHSDLLQIAQNLTDSFLQSGRWGDDVPRIVFGGVANRTNQHIDTQNITDTIRTAMIQSGKFTVLGGADTDVPEMETELEHQQSGAVDQKMAAELGRQLGAEYVLYGRFTSTRAQGGDIKSLTYKFTLNAINVQTRQIIWADEETIRKRTEKSLFGW